ncbi:MAG: BrnT family toxin [Stellaceae bacterium]
MPFEWDERKRRANLAKHGVDFTYAVRIFDGPTLEAQDRRREYGETRIGAFGEADREVYFVVYAWRGRNRRIISARKAGSNERNLYRAAVARSRAPH